VSKRVLATSLLALLAAGLAGCGGSKAPGVVPAPSAGATQASAPAITQTTTTTSTTPAVSTPKPPSPLSKKPVVSVPKGSPPTKLVVNDLIKGTGAAAKAGGNVTVNYVGVLYSNGKQFDASWDRQATFSTALTSGSGGVIPGWVQGIPGMRVGGRRELTIPPSLAYGQAGRPGIPPNATLVFVIDLLAAS
jgi:peptidylprolyl isomerase